ncbi:O-antigen ligase family protein [Thiomonas delicata]|uniref:Putative O-Antigen Polymerase n=1 Tax=Thiomonas delicata TaxID=364030 RepID=A0A238D0Q5_THIDL|nr:O-antigen ligase family protein [Thiomonas delicata]SBP86794.1 putative O-Antigen Polymerase [Thiomonas delicata]
MSAITNSTRRSKAEAPQPADPGTESSDWAGAPLRSTLRLLAVPAVFAISLTVFRIHTNAFILYGFAALFGLLLLVQLRKGPEALLAVLIIYMPLARLYAARIAPGLNGTNSLELLLIAVWIISAYKNQTKLFSPYPFTRMVSLWLGLALISVFTAMARIGLHPFIWNYLEPLRGFLDQFIIFFLFVNVIRDKNMARRLIVYMMVSAAIIYVFGLHEWWETRNYASIEKSRLLGPVGQPNDFAAQVIYAFAPILAYGAYYFPRWKSLRLAPLVLVGLRVLLAAFSRGAYLAFAMELMTLSFVKSKKFLVLVLLVLGTIYFFIPELVPNSMKARVEQTYTDRTPGAEIDKSADSRLILWNAAITMSLESPLLGKGFDQFSSLVPSYVSGYYSGVTGGATDNQNMFLYAASNMGIPSLLTLLAILAALVWRSWGLYRRGTCDIDRIIGLGAVAIVAGLVGVNMFGTHVIDTSVDGFFWVYLAIVARLLPPAAQPTSAKNKHAPRRR